MGILNRLTPWEKEYRALWKQEQRFLERYRAEKPSLLNAKLQKVVPAGLQSTLETAFAKAFGLVFEKGQGAIRLLYQKFLQGIPIVGAAGGISDAVCLQRVQRYAALKYRRRFLLERR